MVNDGEAMIGERPKRNIWDLARTGAKVAFPVFRGDIAASTLDLFLAVFELSYVKRYEEYIEKNLKNVEERLKRLEMACVASEGPALSDEDSCVLAILGEIVVAADRDFFVEDSAEVIKRAVHRGIDEKTLLRSVRFLEEAGYVKGLYHANMAAEEIPRVRVRHDGFDRYLRDNYVGYGDLYKTVVWFLLFEMETKESVRYSDIIANSNFPPVYIIHVLDDLNERGLVKAKIQDYPRDLSFVYGISETLRRTTTS